MPETVKYLEAPLSATNVLTYDEKLGYAWYRRHDVVSETYRIKDAETVKNIHGMIAVLEKANISNTVVVTLLDQVMAALACQSR